MQSHRKREAPGQRRRAAERELIDELVSAVRAIEPARDSQGRTVFRTDGIWRVLITVARSRYCPAIADLSRALGVRRQTAHQLAHAAARLGLIDLEPNHRDKRILQALLTSRGRAELAGAKSVESLWLASLLLGLGDHDLTHATHVVRVIRQRLERTARELAARHGKV